MHTEDPDKREPSVGVEKPKNDTVRTIVKTSFIVALVTGLTSVIYFAVREQPKNFPIVMPIESQPVPPEEPVKQAPQPRL